jgi:hypothetical protein
MSEDGEIDILDRIQKYWEKSNPVTRTNICRYCEAQFAISIPLGWVNSYISRHQTKLIETRSTPQEQLQVPEIFREETIGAMREAVHGRTADPVFNLDEIGILEWEDQKVRTVVVPVTARFTWFPIGYESVSRFSSDDDRREYSWSISADWTNLSYG